MKLLCAFRRQRGRLPTWLRREDGASAIEFALCAPVFIFACIMMADIGFAIHDRMSLDHALRAAAQTAMYDPGEEEVEAVLESTARKNFTVTSGDEETDIVSNAVTVDAARYTAPARRIRASWWHARPSATAPCRPSCSTACRRQRAMMA